MTAIVKWFCENVCPVRNEKRMKRWCGDDCGVYLVVLSHIVTSQYRQPALCISKHKSNQLIALYSYNNLDIILFINGGNIKSALVNNGIFRSKPIVLYMFLSFIQFHYNKYKTTIQDLNIFLNPANICF